MYWSQLSPTELKVGDQTEQLETQSRSPTLAIGIQLLESSPPPSFQGLSHVQEVGFRSLNKVANADTWMWDVGVLTLFSNHVKACPSLPHYTQV